MKRFIIYGISLLLCASAHAETAMQKANRFYQAGVTAERSGDPEKAQQAYRQALQVYPSHAHARYRLGQVKLNHDKILASSRAKKIGAVNLPAYQIEEASFSEAVALLSLAIDKSTEGKMATNFIIEDPQKKLANVKLSLNLRNIPAKAVIEYFKQQAGVKTRYDAHAVVFQAM